MPFSVFMLNHISMTSAVKSFVLGGGYCFILRVVVFFGCLVWMWEEYVWTFVFSSPPKWILVQGGFLYLLCHIFFVLACLPSWEGGGWSLCSIPCICEGSVCMYLWVLIYVLWWLCWCISGGFLRCIFIHMVWAYFMFFLLRGVHTFPSWCSCRVQLRRDI